MPEMGGQWLSRGKALRPPERSWREGGQPCGWPKGSWSRVDTHAVCTGLEAPRESLELLTFSSLLWHHFSGSELQGPLRFLSNVSVPFAHLFSVAYSTKQFWIKK